MKRSLSLSCLVLLLLHLNLALGHGYEGAEFDTWYQPVPHRPVDIVTDVINNLGVRILQQYTAHGNVAFSPTGVGFILAALYEGSAGRGSQQIAEALGLPRDRDITRIGFRDIHRRLRTYLNADGFLGGLTLNQENTRLRPEYEDVLRFYGFDLSAVEDETNETTVAPETTTINEQTDRTIVPDKGQDDDETTTAGTVTETTAGEDDISGETEAATTPLPSTTVSPVEQFETTLNTADQQERLTETTSPMPNDLSPGNDAATTTVSNFQTIGQDTTTVRDVLGTTTTQSEAPSTTTTVSMTMLDTSVPEITTSSTKETTQVPGDSTVITDANPERETPTTSPTSSSVETDATVTTEAVSTDATTSTETEEPTTTEGTASGATEPVPAESTSRSIADEEDRTTTIVSTDVSMGPGSINATGTVDDSTEPSRPPTDEGGTVSTGPSQSSETPPATNGTVQIGSADSTATTTAPPTTLSPTTLSQANDDSTNRIRRRSVRSPRGYFYSYPDEGIWMKDLGIWKPYSPGSSEASVRDSTEISFLVNGCDVSSISASRYMAVLPFAYFPSLHAVALEFPLDDPRYNVLLLMSTNRRDTYELARDLGGKSLRLLRKQLQPTWVRATIPSFMLRGFVTLTSFLQRLGILDVFEPRTADLSVMTPDLGVYVRDVQQSIGVNIRNYMMSDRTHSRNGLFERAGPVPFTAVHPFLYFIVDAETSVALIAGRVNDPLNSRIL